jgi:hypothetical protein
MTEGAEVNMDQKGMHRHTRPTQSLTARDRLVKPEEDGKHDY